MLTLLRIRNFALIEDVSIEFQSGLNVLTGETGAGKSIIIDAVSMLLGDRSDRNLIQTGKESAQIEGLFSLEKTEGLIGLLANMGIQDEEDNSLLIVRQLTQSGRNICKINNSTVTLSMLKEVGRLLLDLHGQHEHQSLLSADQHLKLLDSMGDEEFVKLKKEVAEVYRNSSALKEEINMLKTCLGDTAAKNDLRLKIDEITKANVKSGELEDLEQERLILQNSEKIEEVLRSGYTSLFTGAQNQVSSHDQIALVMQQIRQVSHIERRFDSLLIELENVYYQLKEVIFSIGNYLGSMHTHPGRLDEVLKRINLIQSVRRKYGVTIEEMIESKNRMEDLLKEFESRDERLSVLDRQYRSVREQLLLLCKDLTAQRFDIAQSFRENLLTSLSELGMADSEFKAEFKQPNWDAGEGFVSEHGMDRVEFMISTNPGEPLKPLVKIVSGGEVSRIMLALKSIIAQIDEIPVLIFDEADAGISGRIAQVVAEKMYAVSKHHQVICVTHLPQIAAMADAHFRVSKENKGNRVITSVNRLNEDQRLEEIAKILGTKKLTKISIDHAKEIIASAQNLKV